MNEETIFDRIKALTEQRGKKIVDVEADLGMSKNYLYKWKKSVPSSDKLAMVADYFNVSTDYLLGREGSNENPSIDDIVDNLRSYQGKPIPDDEKDVLKDIIKGYLDRR